MPSYGITLSSLRADNFRRTLKQLWSTFITKRVIAIVIGILTAYCVFGPPLANQQPQSTNITFRLLLDDLIDWNYLGTTYVSIEIRDDNRPSEMTKRITLAAQHRVEEGEKVRLVNAGEQFAYPLAEMRNEWFLTSYSEERKLALKISELTWTNDAATIRFQNSESGVASSVISIPLEARTYRVVAYLTNRFGTKEIANFTQGYGEGKTTEVSLTQPSRFANLWEKISSSEGILTATIAALVTILVGVLKENIKFAFNKLLDLLGKYFGGRLAERRFLKRYLENVTFNHKYLKLIGVYTTGISRPLLEEVFISLRIASTLNDKTTPQTRSTISFNTAFKRYRCIVILGGPGAGKTTTLSYALLAFANNKAKQQLDIDEQLFPIYIPLRRLSNSNRSIIEDVTDKDTQILSAEILREYPANYFERKLKKGQCLLLLDGLDEVRDEKTHREIADRINSFVAANPKNRFVVTCRTAGWKDLLSGEFTVLVAQDFDRDEIQRFVLGWHKAVITQSEYSRLQLGIPDKKKFDEAWETHKEEVVKPAIDIQSRNLIHAIDSNNRILAIAVNPMLLSLISLVHFNRQFLPRERTVLYAQCLELLMDFWDRSRDILSPGPGVTVTQKEAMLREIAFDFQTRGKGEDSRENLERLIVSSASKLGISIPAKDILEDIETRSGLLTERSLGVFGFSHLTWQEYLVAKNIQLNQSIGLLEQNLDNQGWREVILLYTGLVDDATDLIAGVAVSDSLERQTLAGYCLGDAQRCNSEVSQTIIDRLLSELTHEKESPDQIINAIAAIAADFQADALSVEQKLSVQLIERINDKTASTNDRSQAIAIMGKARVTRALPSLLSLVISTDKVIAPEAIKATAQFGNLALPAIEQFLKTGGESLNTTNVIRVLADINTGSSALVLLKLYDYDPELSELISLNLARMMTNPLVETELLQLDLAQVPSELRRYPTDENGWNYRTAKSGFWCLDTKMRHDLKTLITELAEITYVTEAFSVVDARIFGDISFKILFPAFLSYLRSLQKRGIKTREENIYNFLKILLKGRIKKDEETIRENFEIFDALGFDKNEPNKLRYLINQIQTQPEVPLDLALQRIASTSDANNINMVPRGYKLWNRLARAYFVSVYGVFMVLGALTVPLLISEPILEERLQLIILFILFFGGGALICICLILITKRKLKKRLNKQFAGILVNPIPNFLRVLPYITRYKPTTKLIVFQLLVICLSPFPLTFYNVFISRRLWNFLSNPFIVFILTLPVLFVLLSRYYWKHNVIAQNPVIELIAMHPLGRKLIGDTP